MTTASPDASQRHGEPNSPGPLVPGWAIVRGIGRGIVGGLVGTVLMTLYRFPLFRALPPTAGFWAKYVGEKEPEAYFGTGLVLHFMYGGTAGGVFGLGMGLLDFRTERNHRLGAIALSFVYGLALSVFGSGVIFTRLLEEDLEPDELVVFHVAHVIYGLTLGTWMSSQERTGEMYE